MNNFAYINIEYDMYNVISCKKAHFSNEVFCFATSGLHSANNVIERHMKFINIWLLRSSIDFTSNIIIIIIFSLVKKSLFNLLLYVLRQR
jgi:hypothetical protein